MYLTNLPMMYSPIVGEPLKLYVLTCNDVIACFLAEENEEGKDKAMYYLSRILSVIE